MAPLSPTPAFGDLKLYAPQPDLGQENTSGGNMGCRVTLPCLTKQQNCSKADQHAGKKRNREVCAGLRKIKSLGSELWTRRLERKYMQPRLCVNLQPSLHVYVNKNAANGLLQAGGLYECLETHPNSKNKPAQFCFSGSGSFC